MRGLRDLRYTVPMRPDRFPTHLIGHVLAGTVLLALLGLWKLLAWLFG